MMDKETYKRELVRMWDSLRDNRHKGYDDCNGVKCKKCPLHDVECGRLIRTVRGIDIFKIIDVVEKWSESHPEGKHEKHELSEIEYEVLTSELKCLRKTLTLRERFFYNYTFAFSASQLLSKLLKLGYYEGANLDTSIDDYLSKSVVVK